MLYAYTKPKPQLIKHKLLTTMQQNQMQKFIDSFYVYLVIPCILRRKLKE